jgi:uncharacterized repeat protein (TIGR01451 family)
MKTRSRSTSLSLAVSIVVLLAAACSHAAITTRISVDSAGVEGDLESANCSNSADGRYVAFGSTAANLVAGDTNGFRDIFVRDRIAGTTIRVSVDSAGGQADAESESFSISADGRYVVFATIAANLVAGDTNGTYDIFVHDRLTGTTTRASVDSTGNQGDGDCSNPAISADGRYVAFVSSASNLVAGDNNGALDIFVRDQRTGKTVLVSVDSAELQAEADCGLPEISADGRYVVFVSSAANLVAGDTNGYPDIFVRDRFAGTTTRVNVDSAGSESDAWSDLPSISADGRYVAFESIATNLVAGDTNSAYDVFVRDQKAGTTTRVSTDSTGLEGNASSSTPAISADGRFVAFSSIATNLVAGDTDATQDIFVHDRYPGKTTLVSVGSTGIKGDADSPNPSISADGRFVAFQSYATNLVAGDANAAADIFVRDRVGMKYPQADLELVVTSAPAAVVSGALASYTYTVTNHGPKSASEVTVIDASSKAAMSLTPSQGSCKKSAVSVCRLGALASGASATVGVVFKASIDPLTQRVTVGAAQVDSVPANNEATVSTPVTP